MAATSAASNASTVTAAVRRALAAGANKPVRMSTLWETVSASVRASGGTPPTKTQFKAQILHQMFTRGEMTKMLLKEEVKGKPKLYYGMRLRNVRAVRQRVDLRPGARPASTPAPEKPQALE